MMIDPQKTINIIGCHADDGPVRVINPGSPKAAVPEVLYLFQVDGGASRVLLELSLEVPHPQLHVFRELEELIPTFVA